MEHSSTIATKFLIISDTHNFDIKNTAEHSYPFRLPTPKADVLLHCGDLTEVGGIPSFKKVLSMLKSIEAELKLVIPGNHDLELDKFYWEAQRDDEGTHENPEDHERAVETMTGPLADEAGVSFLNEGTHSFGLKSGARFSIYVSPYTPAFCDWAFAYDRSEDRFNCQQHVAHGVTSIAIDPIPDGVDLVMTHGPPKGILDWCPHGNVGCENLLQAIRRVKPIMHCFGHIHEGNGAEIIAWEEPAIPNKHTFGDIEAVDRHVDEEPIDNPYPLPFRWRDIHKRRTLAVNAAVMTGDYKPENLPWLISLELPCSSETEDC